MNFVVREKLPTLNEYINAERRNKYIAAKMKKDNTLICQLASRLQKGKIDNTKIHDFHITWNVTSNRQDPDNVFFAVKFILDGMVDAKVLKKDGRKNVRNIHHYISTKKEYSVVVELIEVQEVGKLFN